MISDPPIRRPFHEITSTIKHTVKYARRFAGVDRARLSFVARPNFDLTEIRHKSLLESHGPRCPPTRFLRGPTAGETCSLHGASCRWWTTLGLLSQMLLASARTEFLAAILHASLVPPVAPGLGQPRTHRDE